MDILMTISFQTRIIIYSLILGAMFVVALILALRHRPDKHKHILCDPSAHLRD